MLRRKKRGDIGKHKFCPVCGTKLEVSDNHCTTCGYSFTKRKKQRKSKLKNFIFILIILLVFYISIRYFNGQSIIPTSLQDALNFSITPKG